MLITVQDAARRRWQCRKRHPGQCLRAALCREAGRDEGMAAWSNQGMDLMRPPPSPSCSRDRTGGIYAILLVARAYLVLAIKSSISHAILRISASTAAQ